MRKISVIVPAHNEERYIGRCLESIRRASGAVGLAVETVVSLNACTDATGLIAAEYGAVTVHEEERRIARVRNTGVKASSGDVLVTIDADSWMSEGALAAVVEMLGTGRYIGGGVRTRPERLSLGIACSLMTLVPYLLKARISAGMFWLLRQDFDALGGFDESLVSAEDYHFAIALKRYGKARNRRFGTIRKAHITTSCRKFDRFGDWYLARNPALVRAIFSGKAEDAARGFYYETGR